MKDEWVIWRLFTNKRATLYEMETYYSLEDVLQMNICLDVESEINSIITPKLPKGKN